MYIDKFWREEGYWMDDNNSHMGYLDDTPREVIITLHYFEADVTTEEDEFLPYMYKYMKMIVEQTWPNKHSGEFYCVMNYLERCGLIEYDVSIRRPWLTEKGKHCYADIGEYLTNNAERLVAEKPVTRLAKQFIKTFDSPTIQAHYLMEFAKWAEPN